MNDKPPADWLEFWVRFVCGALLGGVAGLRLGADVASPYSWLVLPACAVIAGLLAARFGDRFWHGLGR